MGAYQILDVQMYGKHTNVWGMYRCMGSTNVLAYTDIWGNVLGAYKCTGGAQVYSGHTDVWEYLWRHGEDTNVLGDIQRYGDA